MALSFLYFIMNNRGTPKSNFFFFLRLDHAYAIVTVRFQPRVEAALRSQSKLSEKFNLKNTSQRNRPDIAMRKIRRNL